MRSSNKSRLGEIYEEAEELGLRLLLLLLRLRLLRLERDWTKWN